VTLEAEREAAEVLGAALLNGRRFGPIGMSEEKDEATTEAERALAELGHHDGSTGEDLPPLADQLQPTPGLGARAAVARRMRRLRDQLPELTETTRAIAHEVLAKHFSAPHVAELVPGTSPEDA